MPDIVGAGGQGRTVQIRILCSAGCPNTPPTVELVKRVARSLNIPVNIVTVIVDTQEEARKLRFLGSPTVQINGVDIEPSAQKSVAFGLT